MTQAPQTTTAKPPSLAPWIGAIVAWSLAAALILRPTLPNFEGFPGWQHNFPLRIAALATAGLLCGWLFVRTRRPQ